MHKMQEISAVHLYSGQHVQKVRNSQCASPYIHVFVLASFIWYVQYSCIPIHEMEEDLRRNSQMEEVSINKRLKSDNHRKITRRITLESLRDWTVKITRVYFYCSITQWFYRGFYKIKTWFDPFFPVNAQLDRRGTQMINIIMSCNIISMQWQSLCVDGQVYKTCFHPIRTSRGVNLVRYKVKSKTMVLQMCVRWFYCITESKNLPRVAVCI